MNQDFSLRSPVWQKNLDALRRRDRDLLYGIQEAELDWQKMTVRFSPCGQPVLGIRQSGGDFMALDDPNAPRLKSDEWLSQVKNLNLKTGHLMIVGFCTGYYALSLFENSQETAYLWFVEPDPSLLKAAFHLLDFTPLIESPRVRFVTGKSPQIVAVLPFDGVTGNRMRAQGIQVQSPPAAQKLYGAYFHNLTQAIQQTAKSEAMKLKTMEVQGRYILTNSVANLPAILNGAPFLRLVSSAAGIPAIVAGPGPSLEGCLEPIKSVRDRVLIIAVDTALRSLYRGGITPDVIASVDFSDLNARHFEDVPLDNSILAASPTVHPSIACRFSGRAFFFTHHSTRFIQALQSLGSLGTVHVLGSTAHAAYRIAREMGCSPIVLAGIDLAFPGNRRYAEGAIQNELKTPEQSRDSFCEVPANDGSMVKTTLQFKMFRDSLARMIHETHGNAVTTSLQGAQIPGCPYRSFNDVLSEISADPVDKRFLHKLAIPDHSQRRTALQNELKLLQEKLREFMQKLADLIQQIRQFDDADDRFPNAIESTLERFFALQERDDICFKLCGPLCPCSTILLFGAPEQFDSARQLSIQERASFKNKLINALSDFYRAAQDNLLALEGAIGDFL